MLKYPQSGERIRGRRTIQITRAAQPSKKRFAVQRIVGCGELWITEYVLNYDGKPSFTVTVTVTVSVSASVMEFLGARVAREAQYFADPFAPRASRAHWVERMSGS